MIGVVALLISLTIVGPPPRVCLGPWTVTAYCPGACCCGKWADGITASGKPVTFNGGRLVAAPKSIPFGTRLIIPGYAGGAPVPVLDRGGSIKGRRLDVLFPTHQQALKWGTRRLTIWKTR